MATFNKQAWTDFVARYYGDPSYASEVDKDPAKALRAAGFNVPEGKKVNLLKHTAGVVNIPLPPNPASGVSEDDLMETFAGVCTKQCS